MHSTLHSVFIILAIIFSACSNSASQQTSSSNKVALAPDTCNNPDADINCCFVDMPTDVSSIMKIAGEIEGVDKLILSGTIFMDDSITPYVGVLIYAYHTNSEGYYAKSGNETGIQKWHGKLHGWCKTDNKGRYEIHTTRPAAYPNNIFPAHIHPAIKLPNNTAPFYINDFVFTDDPFVTEHYRNNLYYKVGGSGIVSLTKKQGTWYGERDIIIIK